jgi:hypothetical protein
VPATSRIASAASSGARQHVQHDDGSHRAHLLGDFQPDEEQHRQPAWNAAASPQGDCHEQRREKFTGEIDINEEMAELGIKACHQHLRGCAS